MGALPDSILYILGRLFPKIEILVHPVLRRTPIQVSWPRSCLRYCSTVCCANIDRSSRWCLCFARIIDASFVGGLWLVRFWHVFIFFLIIPVATSTSITHISALHTSPAEMRATATLHVAAAVHSLQSLATFWTAFVAPCFEKCCSSWVDSKVKFCTETIWMGQLSTVNADAGFALWTLEFWRRKNPDSRIDLPSSLSLCSLRQ